MTKIKLVCLDADDTLWHNEQFFKLTQERFAALMAEHAEKDHLSERLIAAERRNIQHYGFGIKGFTLSMIETALEVGGDDVPGSVISEILEAGRELLSHPVETFEGVEETLEKLAENYPLVLVTKGDLFDQERKLAASGLGELFTGVEIVSDKNSGTYQRIFAQYGEAPETALMAGNSLKSDVIPALEAGGWGVHIPHEHEWALEHALPPENQAKFRQVAQFNELTALIAELG